MTIPIMVLLAFAGWTLLTLIASVGVYRWSRILTGRVPIDAWRADVPQGCDWYQRAMRAHMNCIENLPIYGAVVVALSATGLHSPVIDNLAITMLAGRIGQTLVHIAAQPSAMAAGIRFALYFLQIVCITCMGLIIAIAAFN
ncbi:MAG: MAPEG family protein [Hyphomicrobium sp.]